MFLNERINEKRSTDMWRVSFTLLDAKFFLCASSSESRFCASASFDFICNESALFYFTYNPFSTPSSTSKKIEQAEEGDEE